jgi:hypothetical protein
MPNGKAIGTWTFGATTGLIVGALIGGALAAATASSPSKTSSSPMPCAPTAPAVTAAPPAQMAAPASKAAARWTERPTQYASGDHLWFSWRSSMVRWLGGQPVPTAKEQRAAAREGWWGETVNTPPTALAHVVSDR